MSFGTPVAADIAYSATKARILSGELAGGALLSEVQVAAELGVSRTPVHEAFLKLATEQLLDLVPRRGAVVRPLSPSEAADVLAMRKAVESAAAQQVFTRGGPADELRAELAANLDRQRDCVASSNIDGFIDADDEFHALIVAASNNAVALHFYEHLRSRQQRLRNVLLRIDPANLAAAHADHQELAAAFLAADAATFESVLATHFDRYQGAL